MTTGLKQRGLFSICTLMLMALYRKPMTKTKIMQELILTYARTKKYLDILTKQELIVYDMKNHTYRLTAKGNEVLKLNQQIADYLPPVREMIRKYSCFMDVPFFDANAMEDAARIQATMQRIEGKDFIHTVS
jgi:predicted transcriptional regulator